MVKVLYGDYDDRFYFEATGHAEGEPEVCAAMSILILSVAQRLEDMDSEGDMLHLSSEVREGYACFDVTPREDASEAVRETFATAMVGIELLEENHPMQVLCV